MRAFLERIPVVGGIAGRLSGAIRLGMKKFRRFPGSASYWESRYATGGLSGPGSYGKLAKFKAEIINEFVEAHQVQSVIELGCGDGNQLGLTPYPTYLGFDVSQTAIGRCRERFASDDSKSFFLMSAYDGQKADLVLSLDVIYHLVEDEVFEGYMRTLFAASERYAIIYSSNTEGKQSGEAAHVRHRQFTTWVEQSIPDWTLVERVPNRYPYRGDDQEGSSADFFIYAKKGNLGEGDVSGVR